MMLKLGKQDLLTRIQNALNGYWIGSTPFLGLMDLNYVCPIYGDLIGILGDAAFQPRRAFAPDLFDCDDFAIGVRLGAAEYSTDHGLAAPLAIGVAWGKFNWHTISGPAGIAVVEEHVCNWAYTSDFGLVWIEPQNIGREGADVAYELGLAVTGSLTLVVS